jgi:hypothetical protein
MSSVSLMLPDRLHGMGQGWRQMGTQSPT